VLAPLQRWAYWSLAPVCAGALVVLIVHLHAIRPDDEAIRLTEGRITLSDDATPENLRVGSAVRLPHDWRDGSRGYDTAWYRLRLELAVAPDRLWSLSPPSR